MTAKNESSIGIVLIIILGFYGWLLAKQTRALSEQTKTAQAIADANQTLGFLSESGIDVSGRLVSPFWPPGTKHTLVFMLRGTTVRADLDFWRNVATLLPKDAGIRLVGYCDGDDCANFVRSDARLPDFPVIAYGEILSSQALVNADAQGNGLLLLDQKKHPLSSKRVGWRAPGQTPFNVVRGALQ
jgi:hypothetical protein